MLNDHLRHDAGRDHHTETNCSHLCEMNLFLSLLFINLLLCQSNKKMGNTASWEGAGLGLTSLFGVTGETLGVDPNQDAKKALDDTKTQLDALTNCWNNWKNSCSIQQNQDNICLLQSNLNDVQASQAVWNANIQNEIAKNNYLIILEGLIIAQILMFLFTAVATKEGYDYRKHRR